MRHTYKEGPQDRLDRLTKMENTQNHDVDKPARLPCEGGCDTLGV